MKTENKKLRTSIVMLSMAPLLGACAMTYVAPNSPAPQISRDLPQPKAVLLTTAKRVLVEDGYQITHVDDSAGLISTAPRNLRVTPDEANCGTTMGIDYLKDIRTTTRVGFGVIVRDGTVTVRTTIEGEYKPGSAMQNITLSCVSRGLLEQQLLQKIASAASP